MSARNVRAQRAPDAKLIAACAAFQSCRLARIAVAGSDDPRDTTFNAARELEWAAFHAVEAAPPALTDAGRAAKAGVAFAMTERHFHPIGCDLEDDVIFARRVLGEVADAAKAAGEAANLDGELLRHVTELEAIHERSTGAETRGDDDALAALLAEYWAVADKIEELAAKTHMGVQAKARVLRSVIAMVGQDDGKLAQHTNGLLRDIIGEARA
jgi:hypothetical protein